MPYVLTNGSSYIRYLPNNSATVTPHKNQARVFQSEVRAQNMCDCLPNIYRKMGFYVNELYADDTKSGPVADAVQTHKSELIFDDDKSIDPPGDVGMEDELLDLEHLIEEVSRFEDVIITLMSSKERIQDIMRTAELEIVDIEHIAEFSVLNAPKAYKVYKRLHDARQLRRKCKNCLIAVGHLGPLYGAQIEAKHYSKVLSGLTTQQYTPRVLRDFYEEICGPKF